MKKINIITFFIMILSLIILSFSVLRLDVLPDKYLIIYFILISILSIIFGLITFINKNKIIRYIITFIIIITVDKVDKCHNPLYYRETSLCIIILIVLLSG